MSIPGSGQQRGLPIAYPNPAGHAAILNMPNALVVDETNNGDHKSFTVFNENMNYQQQIPQQQFPPQYAYNFQYGYAPQTYQQMQQTVQYPPQMMTQTPIQPIPQRSQMQVRPPPQRQKKILQFVNPETNENIFENSTTTAPQPIPPPPPPKSPVQGTETVSTTPSVVDSVRTSTDEVRSSFQQAVTAQFMEGMAAEHHILQNVDVSKESTPPPQLVAVAAVAVPIYEVIKENDNSRESSQVSQDGAHTPSIIVDETIRESPIADDEQEECQLEQKEDKAALLADFEQKMTDYTNYEANRSRLSELVYDRELVELIRQIIRKFNTIKSPLSEDELKGFQIDRTTMPQSAPILFHNKSKYQSGRADNFNPSWAQGNKPNIRYQGRPSGDNRKKQRPAPVTGRPSIQRPKIQRLERGKDAWVPSLLKGLEGEQDRIDKVKKEIRGLLNKITPSTYSDLAVEFINKKVYQDEETLPTVVDLIFTKAVEEPTFVGIYSDLCRLQHEAEVKVGGKKFHEAVIRKCQQVFEGTEKTNIQQAVEDVEAKLKTEEDPKKNEALQFDLEELKGKEKRYMLGTIKFISHLFRIKLLNWKIIDFCLRSLVQRATKNKNELSVEGFLNLLESVGLFMQGQKDARNLDQFFEYMVNLKSDEKISNRVKFMIMDLDDLRNKGWKGKNTGPKTKEEVKAEVMKEEAQNKRDRDAYEVQSLQNRKPYGGRASGQNAYGGRPSKDNREDRKTAAVIAATNSGTNTSRKPYKLEQVSQQEKLTSNKWTTGSNSGSKSGQMKNKPRSSDVRLSKDENNRDVERKSSTSTNSPRILAVPVVISTPSTIEVPSNQIERIELPKIEFNAKKFDTEFAELLEDQPAKDRETLEKSFEKLNLLTKELQNPIKIFERILHFSCEKKKKDEHDDRVAISRLILKSTQESKTEAAFFEAFNNYCKYLVENEVEYDVPHLKFTLPETIAQIVACDVTAVEGSRPNINKFADGLKLFNDNGNKMLTGLFENWVRILKQRDEHDIETPLRWVFEDLNSELKTEENIKQLENCTVDVDHHTNLKTLLIQ